MKNIWHMALKDLLILSRDRMAAFFIVGFPILMGLFFGLVMGGTDSGSRGKMKIAIADNDLSTESKIFVSALQSNENLLVELDSVDSARESIRTGKRIGLIEIPKGFGTTAGILWENPPTIGLGVDPSRAAESAMLQGFIMEAMGKLVGERFQNPGQLKPVVKDALANAKKQAEEAGQNTSVVTDLFNSLDQFIDMAVRAQSDGNGTANNGPRLGPSMKFVDFRSIDVIRRTAPDSVEEQLKKATSSRWNISFPQAMMWGVLGCVAGFAVSIAQEYSRGTMTRLKVSPITKFQLLAGKAFACFLASLAVIGMMTVIGLVLGLKPASYLKLAVSSLVVSYCFVGIMMTLATFGKTEQSVAGSGWAVNMIMAMFGGCMIPVMFMPGFIQKLSVISPIYWAIRGLEGAIWREFTWDEMASVLGVLLAIGSAGIALGTFIFSRRQGDS